MLNFFGNPQRQILGEGTIFRSIQHLIKGIVQLIDKNPYSLSIRELDEKIDTILRCMVMKELAGLA